MTFSKNVVPKESFSVATDVVPILYRKACKFTGDYYFWKRLFKFETREKIVMILQVRALKIVTNGQQHTITNEDEEIYF